ncbi:unnamed protein product [Camellia sinensis]
MRSEPELGEEPPVLSGLEPLFEPGLGLLGGGDLLVARLKSIESDNVFEIDIERVAGRHDVIVVDELDECFDARLLGGFLGGILANHLLRVLGDSGDETVAVGAIASAIVEGSDDHGFPAGVAALEDDYGLVWFQKLHHFRLPSSSLSLAARK